MTSITIRFTWSKPPLRSNDRQHWRARHRVIRQVRTEASLLAKDALNRGLEPLTEPVTATLTWEVTDLRRRDAGASSPTLKAILDGVVDAGVLRDDSWRCVAEERCRIVVGHSPSVRLDLVTAETAPNGGAK